MKKTTVAIFLAALACALTGCQAYRDFQNREIRKRYATNSYPDNPVAGLKTVGVVVLDASARYPMDVLELTSALHAQIQQVVGLEVVPDGAIFGAVQRGGYELPRDGLKLVDDLGLDGLFVAIVTDNDPYGDPMIAIGLTLFSRAAPGLGSLDGSLDAIIQGGRPLPMPEGQAAKPVTAVFAVYDAAQSNVRERVKWFAGGAAVEDAGLSWEHHYRTMPNYMRFVSYEITWALFNRLTYDTSVRRDAASGARAR
jgi:hypothetical protein